MKIAVLSGKGGTGKTFTSVNLAVCAEKALYLDCDVEEPNGYLFLKPEKEETEKVYSMLPAFDKEKCSSCRKCVDFCRFNALAFIREKPVVFPEVCHSCGGCQIVCPEGAVSEKGKEIGEVTIGQYKDVTTVSGKLKIGEASGVPVIEKVLSKISEIKPDIPVIIDCPPGSACSVMESITLADYCIIVAEPTIFGLHNFQMVYELVQVLQKPFGVIINKAEDKDTLLDTFCHTNNISVLCHIPYTKETASNGAKAKIASETEENLKLLFTELLEKVKKEVSQ